MFKEWTSRERNLLIMTSVIIVVMASLLVNSWFQSKAVKPSETAIQASGQHQHPLSMEHSESRTEVESHQTNSTSQSSEDIENERMANYVTDESVIVVDVKGAVRTPGVYELKEGDRVIQAVEKAGGMTDDAASNFINLAQVISDGMMIYVPTYDEINEGETPMNVAVQEQVNHQTAHSDTSKSQKININVASPTELEQLNGIGASRAQAIVQYREENGRFETKEDIMNISGIGPAIFEKIKEDIEL